MISFADIPKAIFSRILASAKKILCATDLNVASSEAVIRAVQLAHQYNSKIIMLNVHEEFLNKNELVMSRVSVEKLQKLYQTISLKAKSELRKLIHDNMGDDIEIDILLKEGRASENIICIAEQHNCDLIIIGSNGKDSITDYILGTTTNIVVNKSKVPVLVVPTIK